MERSREILNADKAYRCVVYDNQFRGRNTMAERLRAKVNNICDVQGISLPTQQILFLYDYKPYKGGSMGHVISLSPITRDLLYQTTGCFYTVAIRLNKDATSHLKEAPLSNVLYHCLRHLRVNEETQELEVVNHHGIEEWPEQVAFANGKAYTDEAPNLFDERIFPQEATPQATGDAKTEPAAK